MPRIHVLMTVYNEAKFLPASLPAVISCPGVTSVTIVEGAYQEVIATGRPARSTDGTVGLALSIVDSMDAASRVSLIQANEASDTQQRNAGLNYIRENYCNTMDLVEDYLMIVDGDEVWEHEKISMVARVLERASNDAVPNFAPPIDCVHVRSRTFVNDFKTYTWHDFPRFFRITPGCAFVNDNYMDWEYASWRYGASHIKLPVDYFHYSFMRPPERMELKEEWWNTRFGDRDFKYDWSVEDGKAVTTGNYAIFEFTGKHPTHTQEVFDDAR